MMYLNLKSKSHFVYANDVFFVCKRFGFQGKGSPMSGKSSSYKPDPEDGENMRLFKKAYADLSLTDGKSLLDLLNWKSHGASQTAVEWGSSCTAHSEFIF